MSPVPLRLVVASGNRHKVAEIRGALQAALPGIEVVGLDAFEAPPSIEESADTFAGNAVLKARGIAAWLQGQGESGDTWVLADDSGICVDALDGGPGVRSARFAGPEAGDADNNCALVHALRARGLEHSRAHYVCVLALVRVDGRPIEAQREGARLFEGRWDVQVRTEARGTGGFGYDPHAWLEPPTADGGRTVAELTSEEKDARSHRGEALRALASWLRALAS